MRRLRVMLVVALAASALVAVTVVAEAPGEPATGRPDKAAQSRSLSGDVSVQASPFANTGEKLGPAGARSLTTSLQEKVPLPDGGNFNGIQFETLGEVSVAEVQTITQFNAACQWLRAQSEGRERAIADQIVSDVQRWSAIRGIGFPAGDPRQLESCEQGAANERAYAKALGLTPTR